MANIDGARIFESVELGKRYPISLSKKDERILTLQYLFKPANVASPVNGQMNGQGYGSNDVTVTLESAEGAREIFKGVKRESASTDHECLLMLSGGVFKVQKVDEVVLNLRVQREENIAKSKESSSKESKALLDSRKLPKFLQKTQPKKRTSLATAPKEASTTELTAKNDNTSTETSEQADKTIVDMATDKRTEGAESSPVNKKI